MLIKLSDISKHKIVGMLMLNVSTMSLQLLNKYFSVMIFISMFICKGRKESFHFWKGCVIGAITLRWAKFRKIRKRRCIFILMKYYHCFWAKIWTEKNILTFLKTKQKGHFFQVKHENLLVTFINFFFFSSHKSTFVFFADFIQFY